MKATLSPDASPVAREVFRRMTEKGYGQKRLAEMAGLNETYVRDLFKAKSRKQYQPNLEKLARALDCKVSDLIVEIVDKDKIADVNLNRVIRSQEDNELAQTKRQLVFIGEAWTILNKEERGALVSIMESLAHNRRKSA